MSEKLKFVIKKLSCSALIVHLRIKLVDPSMDIDHLDRTTLNFGILFVFLID